MALSPNINDREKAKFCLTDDNETAVRTCGQLTGELVPAGIQIAGRITEVSVDEKSWSALPATPLADRKGLQIQNQSDEEIKYNYDSGQAGYVGMIIPSGGSAYIDLANEIVIYAKSISSTVTIAVEEIS